MATTHAVMGAAVALPLFALAPGLAPAAALAAMAGGSLPDLDAAVGEHRKSLHDPLYYWLLALPAVCLALLVPGPITAAVAAALAAAGLHCVVEVAGGGLGRRPWEIDDDRGVYCHAGGRWIPPRRWIRYDGAPEDLLLAVALSVPVLLVVGFDGPVALATLTALAVSGIYAALRKRLVEVAPGLFT